VSRLFIELYLDEDVDVLVSKLIQVRGFAATTTQEVGRLGGSDKEQLAYAVSQHKTLLTHNRIDFEILARQYFASGQTHHGIIIAVRRTPQELVRRLLIILNHDTVDEIRDQLRYI
jgi:hypothetical protein